MKVIYGTRHGGHAPPFKFVGDRSDRQPDRRIRLPNFGCAGRGLLPQCLGRRGSAFFAAVRVRLDSGKCKNINTIPLIVNRREAASRPFQAGDCHIANHSPPIAMKARNQRSRLNVKPSVASDFASLNRSAGARHWRAMVHVPTEISPRAAASHRIMVT